MRYSPLVLLVALVTGSCEQPSAKRPLAPLADWAPSDSLREPDRWFAVYRGEGFTIVRPRDATVRSGKSHPSDIDGEVIAGPAVSVIGTWRRAVDTVGRDGPAFALLARSLPNAARRSLAAVADSVLHAYNDGLTLDDVATPADSATGRIAGERVLVVYPSCGDCSATEVYFVRPERIVVFAWSIDSNDLLADVTAPFYWYILSTFRWRLDPPPA